MYYLQWQFGPNDFHFLGKDFNCRDHFLPSLIMASLSTLVLSLYWCCSICIDILALTALMLTRKNLRQSEDRARVLHVRASSRLCRMPLLPAWWRRRLGTAGEVGSRGLLYTTYIRTRTSTVAAATAACVGTGWMVIHNGYYLLPVSFHIYGKGRNALRASSVHNVNPAGQNVQ